MVVVKQYERDIKGTRITFNTILKNDARTVDKLEPLTNWKRLLEKYKYKSNTKYTVSLLTDLGPRNISKEFNKSNALRVVKNFQLFSLFDGYDQQIELDDDDIKGIQVVERTKI